MTTDRLALFEMLDGSTWREGPATKSVHADPVRGHIAIETSEDRPWIVFADVGPVLKFFSYQGGDLTPGLAREVGVALIAWADKKAGSA